MSFDQAIEYLVNILGPVLGGVVALWLVIEARAHARMHNDEKRSDEFP